MVANSEHLRGLFSHKSKDMCLILRLKINRIVPSGVLDLNFGGDLNF